MADHDDADVEGAQGGSELKHSAQEGGHLDLVVGRKAHAQLREGGTVGGDEVAGRAACKGDRAQVEDAELRSKGWGRGRKW